MAIIDTRTVDGVTYYSTIASDGWPTGPCLTASKALERVAAYEAGEEVSEAAPQQFSRAQMTAARRCIRDGGELARTIQAALDSGLHTEEWCRASARLIRLGRSIPPEVWRAGGARVRKATDEPSLTRGGVWS